MSITGWYNFYMPTPFYHLSLAEDLLRFATLPDEARCFLEDRKCAFLFGNTAPDVQVVSGQSRQATHFFNLPIHEGDPNAWEVMVSCHPALARAEQLSKSHAAFLAGYLCHLQADWMWVQLVFAPAFGPRCTWGSFRQRLDYHNVLRAYLDMRILPQIRSGMDDCLAHVEPRRWLPFVDDAFLIQWRDRLFPQLQPGAVTQTVEVFSSRGNTSAAEFHALLASEERMQQEVFTHLSLEQVHSYRRQVLEENGRLISSYLAFTLHHSPAMMKRNAVQDVR
jgi:hypothetical protein